MKWEVSGVLGVNGRLGGGCLIPIWVVIFGGELVPFLFVF